MDYNYLINFIKKNFIAILLSAVFIFMVIFAGKMISVISSREILEPLVVKVGGLNDRDLSAVKVFAVLARAGNVINLDAVPGLKNEWNNPNQTFIKKVLVGFKKEHLAQLSTITVSIGDKNFVFTKDQFLSQWTKLDMSGNDRYLYDPNGSLDHLIYVAPENVKAEPMNFPMASTIFASINFGGSEKLIQKPLVASLKLFVLIEILLILCFVVVYFARRNDAVVTDNSDTNSRKKEFIVFGLSIIATVLLLFLFNLLILHFYRPDTSLVLENAAKIYRGYYISGFLPEPTERAQFVLSVFLSPFLLFICYRFFNKKALKIDSPRIDSLYYVLSIAFPLMIFAIIYIGLAVSNFIYVSSSYFFSGVGKYLYTLLFFPLGVFLLFSKKIDPNSKVIKILTYLFSFLLTIAIFFVFIFSSHSANFASNLFSTFHFNPVFYPMSQVMVGKIILVNLPSVYGLFPVFLLPMFKLVGLSVLKFTTLMGLLLSLSYLFIFLFLNRMIKNRIILLLGFTTIIFYFLVPNVNPYFQYYPIRIFFPCLTLFLVSLYFTCKNKILYYLIFLLSAVAVLWNLDSGIIVYISWVLTLCYREMFGVNAKAVIKKIFFHLVVGALILGGAILSYVAYCFFKLGRLPDLSLLWRYQKLFLSGYGMIPMPFPHIWVLIAIIFLAGLLMSIVSWHNKNNNFRNVSIFFLSIMGMGLFSYYQGRSHDMVFYGSLYLVLTLLVILVDNLFSVLSANKKLFGSEILFLIMLFFILSSPFNIFYNINTYYRSVRLGMNALVDRTSTALTMSVDFIKKNTKKGEHIIILTNDSNDGLYYGETGTYAAPDLPSSTDIYFRSEVDYLVDFLKCNNHYKLFVYPLNDYIFYDKKVNDTIASYYVVIAKGGDGMVLLQKKVGAQFSCVDS